MTQVIVLCRCLSSESFVLRLSDATTLGFSLQGSTGTVVRRFCDIRSCAGLYPCSNGVVWYANRARCGSAHLSNNLFTVWTARSAAPFAWAYQWLFSIRVIPASSSFWSTFSSRSSCSCLISPKDKCVVNHIDCSFYSSKNRLHSLLKVLQRRGYSKR